MASSKRKVTVLIADDQTLFREGIKDLLEDEKGIEVVGEAADGPETIRLAKKLRPNVILMDIKLPTWTASRRPGRSARNARTPTC